MSQAGSESSDMSQNIYYVAKEPMLKAIESLKKEDFSAEEQEKTFDEAFLRSLLAPESEEGVDAEKVTMVPIDLSAADEIIKEKLEKEEAEKNEKEDEKKEDEKEDSEDDDGSAAFDEQIVKHLGRVGAVKAIAKSYERLAAAIKEAEEKSTSKEDDDDTPKEMSLATWLECLEMTNAEEEEEEDGLEALCGLEEMSELEEEEDEDEEGEAASKKRSRDETEEGAAESTEAPESKKRKSG